ncbi:hypothetical protein AWW66_29795 [Micromonospora rosaria]|uniref:Uncharacterized protein n=1 Tax=Micromonospora rosaria TaxID=47874 RepID=A0A136PJ46_9ACTN|nr:hypothetical protein AWW66_29795 [Micromonospora rosaria]
MRFGALAGSAMAPGPSAMLPSWAVSAAISGWSGGITSGVRSATITAVPYAQISIQSSPQSRLSKRIPTTAFAPSRRASSASRATESVRQRVRLSGAIGSYAPPRRFFTPSRYGLRVRAIEETTSPRIWRIS